MNAPKGPVLGIDGSLGAFSAALVAADGAVLAQESVPTNKALERGLEAIDRAVAPVALGGLAAIAVCTGPGSFAGTRIALSYAKSLALASGLPLAGISAFDAVEPDGAGQPLVAVVPARKDLACARLTAGGRRETRCGPHAELADWVLSFGLGRLWSAGLAEGDLLHLAERGCDVQTSLLSGSAALRIARLALSRDLQSIPHAVAAEYGFAAVTEP